MKNTSVSAWFLALAGFGTWFVAGLPGFAEIAAEPARLGEVRYLLWLTAFMGFGAAFWAVNRGGDDVPATAWQFRALVAVQVVATLLCIWLIPNGVSSVLFVIVASQYAWLGSLRVALGLIVLQTLVATLIHALLLSWSPVEVAFQAGIYLGFQMFALFSSHTALKEAAARERLAQLNAELRATQELLSESSRVAERLRIARELHDLIGHQLTALSLNLEVASHVADGRALMHVQTAHALAKGLLADVREVVSAVREGGSLDVGGALRTLIHDIPTPEIHLNVPHDLGIDDPQRAQVVLRCAQEAITNAVKHAGARNLWLSLERTERGLKLTARDDGRGTLSRRSGNGLTGMRERLESFGGRLSVSSAPGQGFALEAELPT